MHRLTDTIILNDVWKTIKKNNVLKEVNLELQRGLVYGFIGRNGSGKTMLLRAIAGLIVPTRGTVNVFGKCISKDFSFPDNMGIIIENVEMWNDLNGFENLRLIADIKHIIPNEDIKKTLLRVGLDPTDKRKYKAYSLGMKKKLSIAQAVMEKPELIILDEPTNGLDEQSVMLFRQIVVDEKKRGATCCIATHLIEDINVLCDEVYKLEDGRCGKVKEAES